MPGNAVIVHVKYWEQLVRFPVLTRQVVLDCNSPGLLMSLFGPISPNQIDRFEKMRAGLGHRSKQ
jgi:hypothetical protein